MNLLTVRSVEDGKVSPSTLVPAVPTINPSQKYKVNSYDIILPARSTAIDVAIIPPELDGSYFNATLIAIRCEQTMNPRLLRAYFRHRIGQDALEAICQSGTPQKNITVKSLSTLNVPVPPVAEQDNLARLIEIAEIAYGRAVESALNRYAIANEIAISRMFEKGGLG